MKVILEKYILENGQIIFKKSEDGRKLRTAFWKAKKKKAHGTVFFLNGHREFIEKYSETFKFLVENGFNVISLDWRGWGLSDRPFPSRPKVQHISSTAEYQLDLNVYRSTLDPNFVVYCYKAPTLSSTHLNNNTFGCWFFHDYTTSTWRIYNHLR